MTPNDTCNRLLLSLSRGGELAVYGSWPQETNSLGGRLDVMQFRVPLVCLVRHWTRALEKL